MPSHRAIAPLNTRGFYSLTAALGIAAGVTNSLLIRIDAISRLRTSELVDFAFVVVFAFLFALPVATITQRWRPVVLSSLLFGFCYQLTAIVTGVLLDPHDRGAKLLSSIWVGFAVASTLIAIISVLVGLLVRFVVRTTLVVLHEDIAPRCVRCGYSRESLSTAPCPECGLEPGRVRARRDPFTPLLSAAQRWSQIPLAVLLTIMLAAIAAALLTDGLRIHHFQTSMRSPGPVDPAGIMEGTNPDGSPRQLITAGAWMDLPGRSSRGLIIAYLTKDEPGMPAMQLWLATRGYMSFAVSMPPVFCNLDRAQADHVIAHGVPGSLIDAMRAAEDAMIASPTLDSRTQVDPTAHFPP